MSANVDALKKDYKYKYIDGGIQRTGIFDSLEKNGDSVTVVFKNRANGSRETADAKNISSITEDGKYTGGTGPASSGPSSFRPS